MDLDTLPHIITPININVFYKKDHGDLLSSPALCLSMDWGQRSSFPFPMPLPHQGWWGAQQIHYASLVRRESLAEEVGFFWCGWITTGCGNGHWPPRSLYTLVTALLANKSPHGIICCCVFLFLQIWDNLLFLFLSLQVLTISLICMQSLHLHLIVHLGISSWPHHAVSIPSTCALSQYSWLSCHLPKIFKKINNLYSISIISATQNFNKFWQ